jgi:hypothetical protein
MLDTVTRVLVASYLGPCVVLLQFAGKDQLDSNARTSTPF